MDNSKHSEDCICAWCEVERQNVEIRRDREAYARRSAAACSGSSGVEAAVCEDIAKRQRVGMNKYGISVADNPLDLRQWLNHAYEECLDQAVYLKRAMAELDRQNH